MLIGNKGTKIFLIAISLCLLGLANSLQASVTQNIKKQFDNPFQLSITNIPVAIRNVHLSSTDAGYIHAPKQVVVTFEITDEQNQSLPHLQGYQLRFYLVPSSQQPQHPKETKIYSVQHSTTFIDGKYYSYLTLPKVPFPISYALNIQVVKTTTLSKNKAVVQHTIKKALTYRNQKTNLIFLLDNSLSMYTNDAKQLRFKAIRELFDKSEVNVRHAIGKIAIVLFSDKSRILLRFIDVKEKTSILQTTQRVPLDTQTDLQTGFNLTLALLDYTKSLTGKTVVVLLSDGIATTKYNNTHRLLAQRDISIYTIGLLGTEKANTHLLKRISKESRGSFFTAEANSLKDVYRQIIQVATHKRSMFTFFPTHSLYGTNEVVVLKYQTTFPHKHHIKVNLISLTSPSNRYQVAYHEQGKQVAIYPHQGDGKHTVKVRFAHKQKILAEKTLNFSVVNVKTNLSLNPLVLKKHDEPNWILHYQNILINQNNPRYVWIQNQSNLPIFLQLKSFSINRENHKKKETPHIFFEKEFSMLTPNQLSLNLFNIRLPHKTISNDNLTYPMFFAIDTFSRTYFYPLQVQIADSNFTQTTSLSLLNNDAATLSLTHFLDNKNNSHFFHKNKYFFDNIRRLAYLLILCVASALLGVTIVYFRKFIRIIKLLNVRRKSLQRKSIKNCYFNKQL